MPRTVDEARAMRAARPDAVPLAGATAAQLGWARDGVPTAWLDLAVLVCAARSRPARALDDPIAGPVIELSAFAPLEALRTDPTVRDALPELVALIGAIGSAPVRRLGTLGGNLGWPAGDLRPVMLALDATLRFAIAGDLPAVTWPAGDLLLAVRVPRAARVIALEKVGYRAAFSPTLVTIAMAAHVDGPRLAVGGGVTAAQRLTGCESLARGGASARALHAAVIAELRTGGDPLADASERADVAARLIAGHWAAEVTAGVGR